LRLKTVSLSYNFNKKLCEKLKLKEARIYGTAYNLFTWTNYSEQDPEIGLPGPTGLPRDNSRTPPGRRITLGLNIKF